MAVNMRHSHGREGSKPASVTTQHSTSDTEHVENDNEQKTKSIHAGIINEDTLGKGSTYFPAGNQKVIKGHIPVQSKLNPESTKQFEDKKVLLLEIQELKEKLATIQEQNLVLSTAHVTHDKRYEQEIVELQETVTDYEKKLNEEKIKYKDKCVNLEETNNTVNDLQEKLQRFENNRQKYIKEVKALKDNNHKLNDTVELKDEEIHKIKSQNAVLSHRLQEAENKFKSHESMVKSKGQEYKDFIQKLQMANEQFYQQTAQMKEVIKERDQRVNELETDRGELKRRLQDVQKMSKETEVKLKNKTKETVDTLSIKNQQNCQDKEELQEKLRLSKAKTDDLVKQVDSLKRRLQDVQKMSKEMEEKLKNKTKETVDTLNIQNQQNCQDKEELQEKLQLSKAKTDDLVKQVESLKHRLSEETAKENIERIKPHYTPTDIADTYESLCRHEWVDIKHELDRLCGDSSEEDRHRLLCKVLLEAENVASLKYDDLVRTICQMLCDPISGHYQINNTTSRTVGTNVQLSMAKSSPQLTKSESSDDEDNEVMHSDLKRDVLSILFEVGENPVVNGSQNEMKEIDVSDQVVTNVEECIRQMTGQVQVDDLIKDILKNINRKKSKKLVSKTKDNKHFKTYLTECLRLAWKMVTQTPKMNFSIKGISKPWDETYQQSAQCPSDSEHHSSLVQYYLHPTLLYGDQIMIKGQVVLYNKE